MSGTRLACPACELTSGLWEEIMVSGWRELDEYGEPLEGGTRDVDWTEVEDTGSVGCSCGWEGRGAALLRLGNDGQPLPFIHPGQQEIQ